MLEHVLAHTTGNSMAISMVTVCCMSSNIEKGPTIPTCTLCVGYYVFYTALGRFRKIISHSQEKSGRLRKCAWKY
jgi:hypothetical protein